MVGGCKLAAKSTIPPPSPPMQEKKPKTNLLVKVSKQLLKSEDSFAALSYLYSRKNPSAQVIAETHSKEDQVTFKTKEKVELDHLSKEKVPVRNQSVHFGNCKLRTVMPYNATVGSQFGPETEQILKFRTTNGARRVLVPSKERYEESYIQGYDGNNRWSRSYNSTGPSYLGPVLEQSVDYHSSYDTPKIELIFSDDDPSFLDEYEVSLYERRGYSPEHEVSSGQVNLFPHADDVAYRETFPHLFLSYSPMANAPTWLEPNRRVQQCLDATVSGQFGSETKLLVTVRVTPGDLKKILIASLDNCEDKFGNFLWYDTESINPIVFSGLGQPGQLGQETGLGLNFVLQNESDRFESNRLNYCFWRTST